MTNLEWACSLGFTEIYLSVFSNEEISYGLLVENRLPWVALKPLFVTVSLFMVLLMSNPCV